jgi:hypothetical protein
MLRHATDSIARGPQHGVAAGAGDAASSAASSTALGMQQAAGLLAACDSGAALSTPPP